MSRSSFGTPSTQGIKDPVTKRVLDSVIEAVNLQGGVRSQTSGGYDGSLDEAVTFRKLIELGLITEAQFRNLRR